MGLVDRINAQAQPPAVIERADVSLEEFGELVGVASGSAVATKAGPTVTSSSALNITAYWSGCRYITEAVSTVPSHMYRRVGLGNQRTRRASPPWHRRPYPDGTWSALVEFWVLCMIHRGNAYAFKVRNDLGQVVGLSPIHPDQVRAGIDPETRSKVFAIRDAVTGQERPYTTREIFHVPGISFDGYFGIDAIRHHAHALGIGLAGDEYAARFYSGKSHLSGYVSLPGKLKEPEADRMRRQWERLHRGLANAHEFGVLGDGATYNTVGLDAEQAQLLESRNFGTLEVARMLRLPPHKLYNLDRATFSNIEHQAIEAVTDGVRPWAVRIETALENDPDLCRPGNFLEFVLEGLLRGDLKTRYEAYNLAINSGWMMVGEPRPLENFEPAEGLDYFRVPLNTVGMRPDGTFLELPSSSGPGPMQAATALQKLYLAVDAGVINEDEARAIANAAGAELPPRR